MVTAVSLLMLMALAPAVRSARAPCDDVLGCLAALPRTAASGRGITTEKKALATAIQHYGRAAVLGLLQLLNSNKREVRELAAYVLRDLDGLTEAEVPPLLRALERGEDWVAPALGRIGSVEAIEGLYQELNRHPSIYSQVPWAFKQAGARAVPTLLRAFDCGTCHETVLSAVVFVFDELGSDATAGVPDLLRLARDERRPASARRAAIACLGKIGPNAAEAVPVLQQLKLEAPETFAAVVQQAFEEMKVPAAVDALVAKLARDDAYLALRDLADLGSAGVTAGAEVVKFLDHESWTERVLAARTLGYIGFSEAVTALMTALRSEEDWQLVLSAAESLGRLKAESAVGALRAVEAGHWYPPVRDAARKAQAVIAGRESYAWEGLNNFAFEFFDYEHAGRNIQACDFKRNPGADFQPDNDLRRARARSMTYDARIASYDTGPGGQLLPREKVIKQPPSAALEIDGIWLLGGGRGEFGGELVAVSSAGQETVIDDNIWAISRLGTRIVALAGLAHLFSNHGMVYELVRDPRGSWLARPWRVLPGMPLGSALQTDGSWLIHTNGGSVVLSPGGGLTMTKCAEAAR
jgi:HEAT repeat protein